MLSLIVRPLLAVGFAAVLTACDGGPDPGELTVSNQTNRPILFLYGPLGDDARPVSLEEAMRGERVPALSEPVDAGGTGRVSLVMQRTDEGGATPVGCVQGTYWVVVSNSDDLGDFRFPLDPESVSIARELESVCVAVGGGEIVIDSLQ